ncbi:MAG: ankyrin repeat domain-containing protein, partial [Verrucomicrobia bacterium]|nr:ankyrin repeat domain-containing protein [Verrucomicrobiota bacterium]
STFSEFEEDFIAKAKIYPLSSGLSIQQTTQEALIDKEAISLCKIQQLDAFDEGEKTQEQAEFLMHQNMDLLNIAVKQDYSDIIKLLVLKKGFEINSILKNGKNLFYTVCYNRNLQLVNFLFEMEGRVIDRGVLDKFTPFAMLCFKGYTEIVELFLEKGGFEINRTVASSGKTPLNIACEYGHLEIIKILLEKEGVEINKPDLSGATPFFTACANGHAEVVDFLVKKEGVKINQATSNGITPLFVACQKGYIEIVKSLIEQGAAINITVLGHTPISVARKNGHTEIVEILKKKLGLV